ncbi:hypothetical protein A3K73_00220 [Candidatus Pacearchaeota archaeon RBG_13_36_9]|nr:MAG: hypothetical protein A3K73_00220 [Candidatus Pacearchaeota archaeon RBG_13_36_9]
MVERKKRKGKLELSLVVASKWDVLKKDHTTAEGKNAEKVGELDVYEYMKEEAEGVVFYKEVFDEDGKLKRAYFSNAGKLDYGDETVELKNLLKVIHGEYVYIDNKREIENG